jgi:hypothetical protein
MNTYMKYPLVLAAELSTLKPMDLVKKFERGDSDTSASTIRTAGAVFLVVIVVGGIIAAVTTVGNRVKTTINAVSW